MGTVEGGRLPRVTVYHAEGCHLCERALEVVDEVRAEEPFLLEVVDIGGDERLEGAYRTLLPVVEIDGVRTFTYFVSAEALAERVRAAGSREPEAGGAGTM